MLDNELHDRFKFHPATTKHRQDTHEAVRIVLGGVADVLNSIIPEGREKALAITKLEEAMFWANAAVARNGGD